MKITIEWEENESAPRLSDCDYPPATPTDAWRELRKQRALVGALRDRLKQEENAIRGFQGCLASAISTEEQVAEDIQKEMTEYQHQADVQAILEEPYKYGLVR